MKLALSTIEANSRFFDYDQSKVPTAALTVGIGTILDSKEVIIMLNDFFEFKTKKNEPIIISFDRIAFITSYKGKALIFDLNCVVKDELMTLFLTI